MIKRDVYVTIACNCDWERERGLQVVLRNGAAVGRISPFDGHPTNASAYGDDSLAELIYRRLA